MPEPDTVIIICARLGYRGQKGRAILAVVRGYAGVSIRIIGVKFADGLQTQRHRPQTRRLVTGVEAIDQPAFVFEAPAGDREPAIVLGNSRLKRKRPVRFTILQRNIGIAEGKVRVTTFYT